MKKNKFKETIARIDEAAHTKAVKFIKDVDTFEKTQKEKKQVIKEKIRALCKKIFRTRFFTFGLTEYELYNIYLWLIFASFPLVFIIPHLYPAIAPSLLPGVLFFENIIYGITKTTMILLSYFVTQKVDTINFYKLLFPCAAMEIIYDLFVFGEISSVHQSPATAFFFCAFMIFSLKTTENHVRNKNLRYLLMCILINIVWFGIISLNPEHGALIFSACTLFYLFRNYMIAGLLIFVLLIGSLTEGLLCCLLAAVLIFFRDGAIKEELKKPEIIVITWSYPMAFLISATIEKIFL